MYMGIDKNKIEFKFVQNIKKYGR